MALQKTSSAFYYYDKASISDWNAGGRGFSVGAYDGTNELVQGGLGYTRVSRAEVNAAGRQGYVDRSDYRIVLGRPVWGDIVAGLQARYVTRRIGPTEKKFFDGTLGAILPVYAGLLGGLTYENVMNVDGEQPPTVGAGLSYRFSDYGMQLYGDATRLMKGPRSGDRGWALGAEISLAGDFRLRAGRFQDGYRRHKGWSLGISWAGPRASFDYAMRTGNAAATERSHIVGVQIAL